VDVPALIALVAHLLGGMIEILDVIEFGQVSVDSFEGGAHSSS
jgi:hypothetical protein